MVADMGAVRNGTPITFAEHLKRYREAAGLTQEALADRAGLSARTISDLERGLKHTPRHDTLDLLATALALAPEELAAFRALGRAQEWSAADATTLARITPAMQPLLLISYAREDWESVAQLRVDLHECGIAGWIGEQTAIVGTARWEQAQREAIRACHGVLLVVSASTRASRYVPDELRLVELYQRTVLALWIRGDEWMDCVPTGWGGVRCIDARGPRYSEAVAELAGLVRQHSSSRSAPPAGADARAMPRNPYKGLRAFSSADAGDFFGRDALIADLVQSVGCAASTTARFLALLGPSGSGKSSVVMAGLIPRLKRSAVPGSSAWTYLEPLLPGAHPLEALTVSLGSALPGSSLSSIRADLDSSVRGLHLLSLRLAGQARAPVVLVVDQAEELFTLAGDEYERRHFIDLLVTAVTEPAGPLLAIWTLRADFYDRPMNYPALGALLESHSRSVLPMSPADLREAIERPAALPDVGLTFEHDLVGDLLFEVRGQAGALPLLAFTLEQLFERRVGRCMTLAAYHALGGVQGALARHAEATYTGLPSYGHRRLARALFLRLIDPGTTEQETTRRRAAQGELRLPDAHETARMRQTADAFIAARLLVATSATAGVPAAAEENATIEVSHEALIREWSRLGEWLREAREDIRTQQRLSEDAGEWLRRRRPVDNLYRGLVLDEALSWAERGTPSAIELEFLNAGLQERQLREEAEQEQQAQRLALAQQVAAATRSAADRLRYLAGVLAAALIIATGLTALALKNAHDAGVARTATEQDSVLSLSRQLAAQAINHLGDQYDLALLLSVEANRVSNTFEARDSLLRGLAYNPQLLTYLHQGAAGETTVAFSPDGRIMASGGCGRLNAQALCQQGEIRLWDVVRRHLLGSPLRVSGSAIYSLAFSPNGTILASGAFDGSLRLWDVTRQRLVGAPVRDRTYRCYSTAFNPDGTTIACGDVGSIAFWNVRRHRVDGPPLLTQGDGVPSLAFSRDGTMLASGGNDGTIETWDVRRRIAAAPSSDASSSVFSLQFSPDGALLADGSLDGTVQIWDAAHLRLLGPQPGRSASRVDTVAFEPSGAMLAIGSADGVIRLWDVKQGRWAEPPLAGNAGSVSSVAFSPDGKMLASGTSEGVIQLWDPAHSQSLGPTMPAKTAGVDGIAFSRDGKLLASGNDDGSIRLWNTASHAPIGPPLIADSGSRVQSVAFSPIGGLLAAGYDNGAIRLWHTGTRRPPGAPIRGQTGGATGVAFSVDGRLLASGSDDGTIRLWRVADSRLLESRASGHTYGMTGIAFSPDGALLASVGYDGTIRFWSVPQLTPLGTPFGHTEAILSLAFSPDGHILATGSQYGTIWFWDVSRRQALGATITGHSGGVLSLAFSPDGSVLASGGEDLTVRLWDTGHHQALGLPLMGHSASVTGVAFSPDGMTLASGAQDGTVRVTNLDRGAWLAQACRKANRMMTPLEWQQYLGSQAYRPTCPAAS
jgi:WD40 repeat protein/transcriptional regulator with XRE-family HTH domain